MLELIGDVKGLRILDLGCGTMILGSELLEAGAASFTGIDASAEMLSIAKTRVGPEWKAHVVLVEHDLNEPFCLADGNVFGLITSSLAFHYLESWQPVLISALTHLAPGGRFIFSAHHPFADWMNHPDVGTYHDGPTLLHEEWPGAGGNKINVSFYRRPLAMMCKEIADAGWVIERIVEPWPTEQSKEIFEREKWKRVSSKPSFIIFLLRARHHKSRDLCCPC